MVREIVKDRDFLAQMSQDATPDDMVIAYDLLDTMMEHDEECVGMAANMIGELKRIIAVNDDGECFLMFNPEIIKKKDFYEAEENCLSVEGTHVAKRYKSIKVKYQNEDFQVRYKTFTGFTAQIIQHEIDHCMGKLI